MPCGTSLVLSTAYDCLVVSDLIHNKRFAHCGNDPRGAMAGPSATVRTKCHRESHLRLLCDASVCAPARKLFGGLSDLCFEPHSDLGIRFPGGQAP